MTFIISLRTRPIDLWPQKRTGKCHEAVCMDVVNDKCIAQPMSEAGIYMLFRVNRAYIAAHLCEKREIPDSGCQGKCYLNKKLKQENERQDKTPRTPKQVTIDMIAAAAGIRMERGFTIPGPKEAPANYHLKAYTSLTCSIFHPPKAMA